MTAELKRLKAWVENNGYNSADLSATLKYDRDWLTNVLNGRRPIRHGLQVRFSAVFGQAEYEAIFGSDAQHIGTRVNRLPEQTMAQIAVISAVHKGRILHAKAYKCHGCDKQAQQYHHESYRPEDRLCVVPLCRSCHRQHHTGRKRLSFGVVPTSAGVIRIAVACLP